MIDQTLTSFLLKNCQLIDGISDSIRENVDIFIEGERIIEIGNRLSGIRPVKELDLSGHTVLPGLIDTHVHLAFDASDDPVGHLLEESDYITLIKMVINCKDQLLHGVTTIRDLGAPADLIIALRTALEQEILVGPRLVVSGEVITTKGGHCYYIGHEATCKQEAVDAVKEELRKGVDVIKVMASGGSLTPGSSVHIPQFSIDEIEAIVQTAHQKGIKVAAHANALAGIKNAVKSGVDSIEHGSYTDDETLELMRNLGTWLVPTMSPAEILLNSPHINEKRRNDITRNWKSRKAVVEKAIKMGIKMASGTDAGVTFTPHGCVSIEIELFRQLGMEPMQAIWTATCWAADLLGISDHVGIIAEGKYADLIAVEGNPLNNLKLLQYPKLVMINGKIVNK